MGSDGDYIYISGCLEGFGGFRRHYRGVFGSLKLLRCVTWGPRDFQKVSAGVSGSFKAVSVNTTGLSIDWNFTKHS